MAVHFHNEQISFTLRKKLILNTWIKETSLEYGKSVSDINIIFTNDEFLLEMNQKFLKHDFYTDILTFDYSKDEIISGDIYISIDRVKENSYSYDVSFNDELKRVIIHGILHLCGYKDNSETERTVMRNLEDTALLNVKELLIV